MWRNPIRLLRYAGLLDGLSLLFLLFIAMPLKYFAGQDMVVTIFGSVHGFIFVVYVLCIVYAAIRIQWNVLWSLAALSVAFIPFGNFVLDRKLKKAESQYEVKPFNYSLIVYSIVFFSFFDLFTQLPVMSTFAVSLGASTFMAGVIVGLYSFTNTTGNVLSGILMNRFGAFHLIVVGLVLSSCSLLLYNVADNTVMLIIVRIIHGFVSGLIVPAAFTFSANHTKADKQGKKSAMTGTFVGLAAIIGPAYSGIMSIKMSVPFVFNTVALFGFALLCATLLFLRKYRRANKNVDETVEETETGVFFNRGVITAYWGAFILMFSQGVIAYLLPLRVSNLGFESNLTGMLMSTFGIVAVLIFIMPTNRVFDRVNSVITLAIGIGIMGIGQALLSITSTELILYGVLALYGIGFAYTFPSINTLLVKSTNKSLRGKAYGYFYGFFSIGVVSGSALLGWLPVSISGGFLLTGVVLLSFTAVLGVGRIFQKKDKETPLTSSV